jgi:hypothetical protein
MIRQALETNTSEHIDTAKGIDRIESRVGYRVGTHEIHQGKKHVSMNPRLGRTVHLNMRPDTAATALTTDYDRHVSCRKTISGSLVTSIILKRSHMR